MLLFSAIACFMALGRICIATPAPPPAPPSPTSLQLLTAGRPPHGALTDRYVTYDVPHTLVRLTLQKFSGFALSAGSVPAFIHTALLSLSQSASRAGGPTAPLEPGRKRVDYAKFGLAMDLTDVTVRDPEAGGGRLRYDEVKAVYEGVLAVIGRIDYEECVIDVWRMVDKGKDAGGRVKAKYLISGYLVNSPEARRSAAARLGIPPGQ